MRTDYQLRQLYRLPAGAMKYDDESAIRTFVDIAGDDHFDTSKLSDKSRERITTLFFKHFEVQL